VSRRRRSAGAVSLELVLITPLFLLLLDFAVFGGRLTESQSRVDDAAHAGARAASLERTVGGAQLAANQIVAATLGQSDASCHTYQVNVDTSGFRAGGSVAVTVNCDVLVSDLSWLPLPGTRTVSGSFVSAVDTYRSSTP
jgi:Flp pilus assembly protein TadG